MHNEHCSKHLTTGAVLQLAYNACNSDAEIKKNGVGSLPIWGEKTREKGYDQLKNFKEIVTIEEHLPAGGCTIFRVRLSKAFCLKNTVCGAVVSKAILQNMA